jgi:hypothetical protein
LASDWFGGIFAQKPLEKCPTGRKYMINLDLKEIVRVEVGWKWHMDSVIRAFVL